MKVFIVFRTYMSARGWALFRKIFKSPADNTVKNHTKKYMYDFKNGIDHKSIKENLQNALKVLKDSYKIDIQKTPCLICEDDTAMQPHLDAKVYSKEEEKIELYGFSDVKLIRSFEDIKDAFTKGEISTNFRAYVLVPLIRHAPWITIGNIMFLYYLVNLYYFLQVGNLIQAKWLKFCYF